MKKRILHFRERYQSDKHFKLIISTACSTLLGIVFALFNAALGILYQSVWNGSICVYYLLLATVRGILVLFMKTPEASDRCKTRKLCRKTHIIMIFTDICLIAPIAYMVMGARAFKYGLIPAITMAAYTTYRVTMGVLHYLSSRKQDHLLVKELRVINLQDALVSVLSLQNALIIATGSTAESMLLLTGWTSGAIWLMIVFFTVKSFRGIGT